MTDQFPGDPPSPFIISAASAELDHAPSNRRALDVAMGRGRHALPLAELGWRVFGVDANLDALRDARTRAATRGLVIRAWCADLTRAPLPQASFELVVVTRYLQRDLFGPIRHAVVAGGLIVYETFTVHQRALGSGPKSSEHLLEPGELRAQFDGFEILSYEEVTAPEAVARVVARKQLRTEN